VAGRPISGSNNRCGRGEEPLSVQVGIHPLQLDRQPAAFRVTSTTRTPYTTTQESAAEVAGAAVAYVVAGHTIYAGGADYLP
jgi:hypothetical protein